MSASRCCSTRCWYKIKNRAYTQAEGRGELFWKRQEREAATQGDDSTAKAVLETCLTFDSQVYAYTP